MQQGADLRGMYLWTLVDNFEWHEAFQHHFGLYACDMGSPALERVPRSESVATVQAIHALVPATCAEVVRRVDELVVLLHEPVCSTVTPADANGKDVQWPAGAGVDETKAGNDAALEVL